MDCIAHGVAKSQTRLRDFHSLTQKREGVKYIEAIWQTYQLHMLAFC